ncbi:hypothetical protein [Streptomyces sp. NPDC093591]|uniref:hypothetical protein n=1 Tax=Streptomyces sp. NPDC093591 TaxID=3366044 RepID=UPI0037F4C056
MPGTSQTSWGAFLRLFARGADGIRVALDWEGLGTLHRAGHARIVRADSVLTGRRPPCDYYAPWYADPSGRPTDYRAADARPLCHADLSAHGQGLTADQRERVGYFERALATQTTRLCLPTLDLGGGRCLVLDGNHRLIAALRLAAAGTPRRISEFRVTLPLDRSLLPDLRHWVAD